MVFPFSILTIIPTKNTSTGLFGTDYIDKIESSYAITWPPVILRPWIWVFEVVQVHKIRPLTF